ncbi:MAG: flagellar basal body rod protein FlgC [Gammaproteobacteria bacterium]|nr:MAG: flagellar basal body rod protein FlgC [Gammaproteobacteria bacterium]
MSLLDVFDIAGSAMAAQNVRLNTTASNLANAESVSSNMADTYRARHPVFASRLEQAFSLTGSTAAQGVQVLGIVASTAPLNLKYEPHHPLADDAGYVAYPNVNVVEEMADMMSATRSFQLNVEILNSVKSLAERLLTMGQ